MATQPDDNPGGTPAEVPVQPSEPGEPMTPPETQPDMPDFDQPDEAPVEMPPPD